MWSDQDYLKVLASISSFGQLTNYEIGDTVCRGFADVGFEEFILLPNLKLCSTFTAKVTDLQESERRHFFLVPSFSQLGAILSEFGLLVTNVNTENGARWSVEIKEIKSDLIFNWQGKLPELGLAHAWLKLLNSDNFEL